jgi:hypothetical protein
MLTPARPPVERLPAPHLPTATRRRGWRRARRIACGAALLCLIPVAVSYITMLGQPSNSGFGIRTVEWLRDNGARGVVNRIENFYYSLNAPPTGGRALTALPTQPGEIGSVPVHHHGPRHYHPPRIVPVIHPALRHEGVWRATSRHAGPRPPVLITSFRPDPNYPQLVAGVAWIDHTRTSTWLYPGRLEPNVAMGSRGPMAVPADARSRLVATFNSGFKLADSGGGYAEGGHTYAPLKAGLATFVRHRNGRVNIDAWRHGPNAPADIQFARQNLPLIVDHGRPNPNLSDGPQWGATLGYAIRVWRSAVGIDRHGNLLYGAASDQTVGSLAAIMIRAGAVRAMELDINTYWVSFITYGRPGAGAPANLLPSMDRPPTRYLTPDDRDFFAVYTR